MKRTLITTTAIAILLAPATVLAEGEDRVTINLRGGGLARNDDGYADHAGVFGLSGMGLGGGGIVEAGVRVAPRLRVFASWSGFTSVASKRVSELTLTSTQVLGHLRYRVYQQDFHRKGQRYSLILEASLGAGRYKIEDNYDGESRSDSSFGGRAGAQFSFYWRAFGYGVGYAYHHAPAQLEDRLGGRVRAGGHEFTGGLSIRF